MIDEAAARVSPQDDLRSEGENDHALIERVVAVNSAPELADALRLLVETARGLLEADLVTLVAWDEGVVRGVVCGGAGDGAGLVGEELGPGSNPPYLTATSGEPIVERSGSKAEGVSSAIAQVVGRLATRVTVPLAVQGAPVLTFQAAWRTRRSDATVARGIRTLQTLGALTGIAYRAEEERRRARDRARLETVLEAVDDGFWLISEDSVVLNTAARRLLRLPKGAAPDFGAFNLRTLDGQPLDVSLLAEVVRSTRLPQDFCLRVTRFDGAERIFEGTTSPIVAGGGVGTVSVFRDVTERREREVLTERFLERLFDALPTGVILLHPTTRRLLSSNRAFATLVGYEPAEIEGIEPPLPWWTSTPADLYGEEWAPPEGIRCVDALFRRKDGEHFPVEITRFWIRDLDGTPLAAVALITDLSERRRFEQQLLVSGKLATIGELAAGVAHEINNPLFAILGLVEFLLKEAEPGTKTRRRLELVQETGLEIKAIVRALLDFARERSDEQGVVSLREVLSQTVELLRRTSAAKQVEIVERYCAEETLVHASSGQLKQVFVNLVANAQQAMPAGGTIEIELERDGDWLQAAVRDDGPGIAEDIFPRIFEPFFTTKRSVGGTGLGLPVSLGIAQMHAGELLARSTPGEGATFVLRLPAYREAVT